MSSFNELHKPISSFLRSINIYINTLNSTIGKRGTFLLGSIIYLIVCFLIFFKYLPEWSNIDKLGFLGISGEYVYYAFTFICFLSILYVLAAVGGIGKPEENIKYEPTPTSQVIKLIILLLLFGLFFYILYAIYNNDQWLTLKNLWIVSIIIFGLALVAAIFNDVFKRDGLTISDSDDTYISIIKNLIFYIPCLIVDFIDTIQNEYNLTPKTSYIILIIETIIILLYFFGEIIGNFFISLVTHKSITLVNEPIRLNNSNVIGTYPTINPKKTFEIDEGEQDYDYALSSWIYINPQYNTDTYKTLLDYGNKPIIEYKGQTNSLRIKIKSRANNEDIVYETTDYKLQKWNNFVINVYSNQVDIHLNNELIVSEKYDVSTWNLRQSIKVGDQDGIEGSICNVNYYNEPLSKFTISLIYNMFKDKNTPVL
uniref:Uncharacterized protein n=1 Tax=viral metagenome TaxID=1070528 RepID=A0A6C0BU98_9ZZZZ